MSYKVVTKNKHNAFESLNQYVLRSTICQAPDEEEHI